MATTGVTWSVTASGATALSAGRLRETLIARPPPSRAATIRAFSAIQKVCKAEPARIAPLSTRARATSLGGGRK